MTSFLTIRSYVTKNEHAAMCVLRTEGATLPLICRVFSRNLETVYRHTFHIPHVNRLNRTIRINAKSGKRIVVASRKSPIKGLSMAEARMVAQMRGNRIKVRGVVKA
jgi:hypothetical protein